MVATLNDGFRRSDQRHDSGKNTYDIGLILPRHRQRIFEMYWVERLPQTAIAQHLHLAQSTVSEHIAGIRLAYANAGRQLPRPKTVARPKAVTRRKYISPGVIEIDVPRLVNMLRGLRKSRSGSVGDATILGTVVNAIDDDTVLEEIARLVRPAAGPVGRRHV